MKTLIIGLLCICLTGLTFAQNEIAYIDARPESSHSSKEIQKNSNFLNFALENGLSKRIIKLQKLAANYDISKNNVYDSKGSSIYRVEFTKNENQIIAKYNHEGQIIESNETYKNIRLPYAISSQISKSNPGWSLDDNILTIKYFKGKDVKYQYEVVLKKVNKSKIVVIN